MMASSIAASVPTAQARGCACASSTRPRQQLLHLRQQQLAAAPRRQLRRAAIASADVTGEVRAVQMVNLIQKYFGALLTDGSMEVGNEILDASISHKDMVRNIGRVGLQEYAKYLKDLHVNYPDYYAKPLTFGYVDSRSMFVSFEGQISVKTPKFCGVDLFIFNESQTKIKEVQVFRSNWLGAQGHEERKKMAEASARVQQHRGQMP